MNDTNYTIYTALVVLMIVLSGTLGYAIIPTETTEENRPLLWGILSINFIFAFAVYLFIYYLNTVVKENIFHVSMIFTFLVALPITLYNMGVTTILFSN